MSTLLKSIQNRRSVYHIKNESPLPNKDLIQLLGDTLQHTPSAFNMQSTRIVLLLGQNHLLFWNEVKKALKSLVSKEQFPDTEKKINSFQNGYGTVLFFEDISVIDKTIAQFPTYKDNFIIWSEQANGMVQSNIWMVLEDVGLGASLQHYNPIIDKAVYTNWKIPKSWRLTAQMPFGIPTASPADKTFVPLKERMKVFD